MFVTIVRQSPHGQSPHFYHMSTIGLILLPSHTTPTHPLPTCPRSTTTCTFITSAHIQTYTVVSFLSYPCQKPRQINQNTGLFLLPKYDLCTSIPGAYGRRCGAISTLLAPEMPHTIAQNVLGSEARSETWRLINLPTPATTTPLHHLYRLYLNVWCISGILVNCTMCIRSLWTNLSPYSLDLCLLMLTIQSAWPAAVSSSTPRRWLRHQVIEVLLIIVSKNKKMLIDDQKTKVCSI